MSIYVELVCRGCGKSLFLGKQLWDGRDRVFGYWDAAAGTGKNWQVDEIMFSLFSFLAEHAGHRLEVLDEHQLGALGKYPEHAFSREPSPAELTGLEAAPGAAVLASAAQDRGFLLGRPLTHQGRAHLFTGYLARRGSRRAFRPIWSLLARSQTLYQPLRVVLPDPVWGTSTVTALARGIHDDRAFDRMSILADALEDAGCTDGDILGHCRDPRQVHHRGCWVVDLLLGRE